MKSITYWLKSTQSIDYNKRLKIEKSNIIQILANTVKPFNSRFQNVIRFKSLNEWFINSLIQLFGFKDSYLSFRWQQMHVKCENRENKQSQFKFMILYTISTDIFNK